VTFRSPPERARRRQLFASCSAAQPSRRPISSDLPEPRNSWRLRAATSRPSGPVPRRCRRQGDRVGGCTRHREVARGRARLSVGDVVQEQPGQLSARNRSKRVASSRARREHDVELRLSWPRHVPHRPRRDPTGAPSREVTDELPHVAPPSLISATPRVLRSVADARAGHEQGATVRSRDARVDASLPWNGSRAADTSALLPATRGRSRWPVDQCAGTTGLRRRGGTGFRVYEARSAIAYRRPPVPSRQEERRREIVAGWPGGALSSGSVVRAFFEGRHGGYFYRVVR